MSSEDCVYIHHRYIMMWSSLLCNTGTLDRITPHGVRMLRAMVNDSVLDVMYYMSHRFGPEVWVCICVYCMGGMHCQCE